MQFEDVIIVIGEGQRPIATSPDKLADHGLEFGGGSRENFRCGVKSNLVSGPDTLNGCANQHNPGAWQSDECLEMSLFVLTLNRSGVEEVTKQHGCPGGVLYYEGDVANCLENASTRQACCHMIAAEESIH